jgi:flagellar protein FlgJ
MPLAVVLDFGHFDLGDARQGRRDGDRSVVLEFENGLPKPQLANFRAYDDVAATFDDYSELLLGNPRYAQVRDHGGDVTAFAEALQSSGYATDPAYADKIQTIADSDVIQRVRNDHA